jgi:hypothetical protein
MKKYYLFFLIIAIGVLWSCDKQEVNDLVAPNLEMNGFSYIKVVQVSPTFRQIHGHRDSINIYVNNQKVNGTFLTYNSFFPASTSLYAAVPSGTQTIRLTLHGVQNPDSITLFTLTKNLDANSYYSFIITDSVKTQTESKQMWLKDEFNLTDSLHYTMRFVHAVLNDSATVDVYSMRNASNIFTNIAPGTATPFRSFNYTLQTDTLIVRTAGTQTEIARINNITLSRTRAYTLLYKGQRGVTGTRARSLVTYISN